MEELEFDVGAGAGVDEDYEDYDVLYDDVNVGFFQPPGSATQQQQQQQEEPIAQPGEFSRYSEENGEKSEQIPADSKQEQDSRVPDIRKEEDPVAAGADSDVSRLTDGKTGLLISDLHWWTTDAEIEAALSEFGRHKGVKFSEERASGKSKGNCTVEFYDPAGAQMCKEKMNGRLFNGRPCVVEYVSSSSMKQANNNKSPQQGGASGYSQSQGAKKSSGSGRGSSEGGRGYGGKPGLSGRGPGRGRGRGGDFGGLPMGMYDPAFGGPRMFGMGYMPRGPYPMPFPPGVAPHVNPAFFGRGSNGNVGGYGEEGYGGYDEENTEYGYGGDDKDRKRSKDEKDWDRDRHYKEKDRDSWDRDKDRGYKSRDKRYEDDYDEDYKRRRY